MISVGPVLDELEAGVGLSAGGAGLLTTLPVLSFALLGSLTPRLARRHGERRVLCGALLLMTDGAGRAGCWSSDEVVFLLLTRARAGRRRDGQRPAPGAGQAALPGPDRADDGGLHDGARGRHHRRAAAVTVPLAVAAGDGVDWRLGLGLWALLAALGRAGLGGRCPRPAGAAAPHDAARPAVHRSRTAWALALYFGAQSMQAYISFGWFALYFRERAGASATRAGLYVAVLAAVAVPVSAVVPAVAARFPDQRRVLAAPGRPATSWRTPGMARVARRAAAGCGWCWPGVGGGTFPLALTMIGLRTRTTARHRVDVGLRAERRLRHRRRRPAARRRAARRHRRLDLAVRPAVRRPGADGRRRLVRRAARYVEDDSRAE